MGSSAVAAIAIASVAIGATTAQEPPDRRGAVQEQAFVERVIVDAYVTRPDGYPIPYLTPSDFRVRVDGKAVVLESVDWLPAGIAEVDVSALEGAAPGRGEFPPGRLIVMFFQTDEDTSRFIGLMRMALQARKFLATLLPTDRVAVVSFDSHLKLRQDFTADRDKLEHAIDASILRGDPPAPDPESHPSLASHLDPVAARKCHIPEEALVQLARALAPIPGGKSMLFFGWGLATIGGMGGPNRKEWDAWDAALLGMAQARINVFTFDVTDSAEHGLAVYLQQLANLTGGRYEKTHIFANLAMDRVRRAISGRYVLVFVKPQAPHGQHAIDVALVGHKGWVYARPYYVD